MTYSTHLSPLVSNFYEKKYLILFSFQLFINVFLNDSTLTKRSIYVSFVKTKSNHGYVNALTMEVHVELHINTGLMLYTVFARIYVI